MKKSLQKVRLSFSHEGLTHFGGVLLLQKFFHQLRLRKHLHDNVRFYQRNNRYSISKSILALLYPILLGLGRIETTYLLKQNGVFQALSGLRSFPNSSTLRRFLIRFSRKGLTSFRHLHDRYRIDLLQKPSSPTRVILDLDTTVLTVFGRQEGAKRGFNPKKRGRPSYQPLLCFEGRSGDCWAGEYYPGNIHPAPVTASFLNHCFQKLPHSVQHVRIRADAAFFSKDVVNTICARGGYFAIVAQVTKTIKSLLGNLSYQQISPRLSVAEFHYQPQGWEQPHRFIVIRRPIPEERSWQLSLFKMDGYTYRLIVTNLPLQPLNIWRFYNKRATGELIIKELLHAYAMKKIPTGDFLANEAYFHLLLFAYNLLNWFKRLCLPATYKRLTLQTIRDRLLSVPAELIRPQGKTILKLSESFPYKQIFSQTLKNIILLKI